MKIGMNIYVWTTSLGPEFYGIIDTIKKAGYDGVEVPVAPGNPNNYAEIRKILDGHGLACTTITNVGIDANPAGLSPTVRQRALDQLKWAVDISATLGSENMVGPYQASYGVFSGRGVSEQELAWSCDIMQRLATYASSQAPKMKLSVEFLNRFEAYFLNTTEESAHFVQSVGRANFGILYDTHHAHHEESDLAAAIRCGGKAITHVHFSESQRGTLGGGLVDWQTTVTTLKEIGYDGWIMAEGFSKDVPGLASAAHVWRNTFQSPNQFCGDAIRFMRRLLK
jgi:D-psicose/D-tagatose/L-ribulose 3-epimerase